MSQDAVIRLHPRFAVESKRAVILRQVPSRLSGKMLCDRGSETFSDVRGSHDWRADESALPATRWRSFGGQRK